MLWISCGSSDKSEPAPAHDASVSDAGAEPGSVGPPELSECTGKSALSGGDSVVQVNVGGVMREARVHVPPKYDPTHPTPLVLNFHGSESNAAQQEAFSMLDAKADAAGFIAVHPEGVGGSFNAGTCCDPAAKNNVDDVGFVRALLDKLDTDLCVASKHVYATGISNGAELAHRLGCELADRIAAIAPVAGGNLMPSCDPARPISVLHMHGTADDEVPYAGDADHPPVADTIADWAKRDGCSDETEQTFNKGDTHCDTHTKCKAGVEVTLCTIEDGGHTWPGGVDLPDLLGKTTHDLIANDAMWEFFQKHPRP
jgi:polyhydroxybutyrate depolymerase